MNLGIRRKLHKNKHWVYFPEGRSCFFRVGFFHNFCNSSAPYGKGSVYAEVSYRGNNKHKQDMPKGIIKGLKDHKLISSEEDIIAYDINDIKYGYPIYDANYSKAKRRIADFLSPRNVFPCGRYGSWSYMSMEDAILDGKRVADTISS